jgi:hypothetical protein
VAEEPEVVRDTGLVVLTQGDVVFSDPQSQAVLARLGEGALVLEFPVEVEVRIVPACDPDQHVDETLTQLTSALRGLV